MLFDTGPEYDFMLVPVPSWPGITMPFTVDDLFTSKWVHTSLDYEHWENLGKYKRSVAVGSAEGSRFYSVHFAGLCYSHWKGAVLVIRTRSNGEPVSCHVEDVLYVRELLTRYKSHLHAMNAC